jgi:phosphoglycolate phosphatase-like HAD superfamily hydrolase
MFIETPGSKILSLPDVFGVDHLWGKFGDYLYSKGLGRNPEPFTMTPGVMDMLSRLKTCYSLAVISSRGQRTTQRFIDQFCLSPYFKCITTSLTCRHSKPYPDPVLWAASQIGISPRECLMVGDTSVDIQAGKAAGAQTVGVLCGFGTERELKRAGADLILTVTPQLLDILPINQ